MTNEQKQFLANSYANAWMAVKGGTTTVTVLDHGWYSIKHSYLPQHPQKVRAEKLLKGLSILTGRLLRNELET
jgi:hypothetical protein